MLYNLLMRTKQLALTSLIVLTSGALAGCFSLPALAIEYGGIGGRPANPKSDNPRTQSIFVHEGTPGTVIEDGIVVINNSPTPKTLFVYATDIATEADGEFSCEQLLDTRNDVGTWVEMEKSEVTLASKTSETVNFKINIPATASVGENNGCIAVQEKKESAEGSGVTISTRTALRLVVTVPGDIKREVKIAGYKITLNDNDNYFLHPSVTNTGNVSIDTDIQVSTRYWFGLLAAKHGGEFPVLRGQTSEWNFELIRPFWGGLFFSTFKAGYDPSLEASVGKNTGDLTYVRGPIRLLFVMPHPIALVVELLVLLLLLWGIYRFIQLRKRNQWMQSTWVEYKVKPGDDLMELADKYDVDWKLMAKRNKLKPPYNLKKVATIYIPSDKTPTETASSVSFGMWLKSIFNKKKVQPAQSTKTIVSKYISVVSEPGDKLKDVADYAGITVAQLAKINNIKNSRTYKLRAGTELKIPNPDN